MEWTDPATGFECLIRRNMRLLFLCGYVKVAKDHPAIANAGNLNVHGGVTFNGEMSQGGHYVGFDCGHYGDYAPGMYMMHGEGTYRDIDYVKKECEALAWQIKELETST